MDLTDDTGDVAPSFLTGVLELPRFWITDIVEVDAIDVVATGHLTTDASDIVARLRQFWVHIVLVANSDDPLGIFLAKLLASVIVALADGDGDNPGVTFHTPLVTLFYAKQQRIVAWGLIWRVGQDGLPGFDGRGIDGGASDTGLKQNGIDVSFLILVEDADQIASLLFRRGGLRPVQTLKSGEPDGPHLMLGRLGRDVQSQCK